MPKKHETKPEVNKKEVKKTKPKFLIFIIIFLLLLIGCFVIFVRIRKIPEANIAIVSRIKTDDPSSTEPLLKKSGLVMYIPLWENFKLYSTSTQHVSYNTIKIYTSDGIEFQIKPDLYYQLNVNKALDYYKILNISLDSIGKGFLKEVTTNVYTSVISSYNADSLVENRSLFESIIQKELSEKLDENYLILNNINSNLQIPFRLQQLIDLKNQAKQNTMLMQERLKEEYAKANLIRVRDSLLFSPLTDLAIQKMFIEKWDGKLNSNPNLIKQFRDINNNPDSAK